VYSDRSLDELRAWGKARGLKPEWIHRRKVLSHFDVLAESVAEQEPGVSRSELVADIRWWRDHLATSGPQP
jgi:hypothetical protein